MDNREFEFKAKDLLAQYIANKKGEDTCTMDPLFIVWSAKILQNNAPMSNFGTELTKH